MKTESVKKAEAETKTAAKKTTTKKTTAKKTTARKTTAKKEIKSKCVCRILLDKQVEERDMIARVKKAWTSSGKENRRYQDDGVIHKTRKNLQYTMLLMEQRQEQ